MERAVNITHARTTEYFDMGGMGGVVNSLVYGGLVASVGCDLFWSRL